MPRAKPDRRRVSRHRSGSAARAVRRSASRLAAARQPRPEAADDVAMPPQDRAGVTISRIAASRSAGSVPAAGHAGPATSTSNERDASRAGRQRTDGATSGSRRPSTMTPDGQAQPRNSTGDNEEDQLQAHKPKIIARPPACEPATNRHARAQTLRPPRRIRPGDMRFRHPWARGCSGQVASPAWAVSPPGRSRVR